MRSKNFNSIVFTKSVQGLDGLEWILTLVVPELRLLQEGISGLEVVAPQVVEDEQLQQQPLAPLQRWVRLNDLVVELQDLVHYFFSF